MINENFLLKIVSEIIGKDCKSMTFSVRASDIHFEVVTFAVYNDYRRLRTYKWHEDEVTELNKRLNILKPHLVSKFFGIYNDDLYTIPIHLGDDCAYSQLFSGALNWN